MHVAHGRNRAPQKRGIRWEAANDSTAIDRCSAPFGPKLRLPRLIGRGTAPKKVKLQTMAGVVVRRPFVSIRKTYSLAELIDLAEAHNPETRVAWEGAKAEAAALGIAR